VCDYYSVAPQENVVWDLENLFYNNDVKSFNLSEFIQKDKKDKKHKEKDKKHKHKDKKHKKRANDVEEDPVDSERGPDPQQQAKDRYNQSVPTKDIEQKQVINWEDINYPPVLRLFHYNYHELKSPIEFQICQWEQWIFIFQSAILMFNRKLIRQKQPA
jgi:hypothetical protein